MAMKASNQKITWCASAETVTGHSRWAEALGPVVPGPTSGQRAAWVLHVAGI